jgi:hypothetical protein
MWGGDVAKVADALAVVDHFEVLLTPRLAPDDGDRLCSGVDRVFDELGDRLEGVVLGEGDDADRVPLVADPQSPLVGIRRRAAPLLRCHHRSVATMAPPGKLLDDRVRRLEHRRGDFDPKAGGDAGVENHRHL